MFRHAGYANTLILSASVSPSNIPPHTEKSPNCVKGFRIRMGIRAGLEKASFQFSTSFTQMERIRDLSDWQSQSEHQSYALCHVQPWSHEHDIWLRTGWRRLNNIWKHPWGFVSMEQPICVQPVHLQFQSQLQILQSEPLLNFEPTVLVFLHLYPH